LARGSQPQGADVGQGITKAFSPVRITEEEKKGKKEIFPVRYSLGLNTIPGLAGLSVMTREDFLFRLLSSQAQMVIFMISLMRRGGLSPGFLLKVH
jgi:hypothetical protein